MLDLDPESMIPVDETKIILSGSSKSLVKKDEPKTKSCKKNYFDPIPKDKELDENSIWASKDLDIQLNLDPGEFDSLFVSKLSLELKEKREKRAQSVEKRKHRRYLY